MNCNPRFYVAVLVLALGTPLCHGVSQQVVVVAEEGANRVSVYSVAGAFLANLNADVPFNIPTAAAFDAAGNLLVADGFNSRIVKFSATGSFAGTLIQTTLKVPNGIAFTSTGNILVSFRGDPGTGGYCVYTPAGTQLNCTSIVYARGVALDGSGRVYVTSSAASDAHQGSNAIYRYFSAGGSLDSSKTMSGSPRSLLADFSGNLTLAITGTGAADGSISLFDTALNAAGNLASGLVYPNGLAYDPAGRLWVSFYGDGTVKMFTGSGQTTILSGLSQPTGIAIGVLDLSGANCTYSLSPSSQSLPGSAGTNSTQLTANSSACSWTASSDSSWLTVTNSSGTGSATIGYTVQANAGAASRTGHITINAGDAVLAVTQNGSSGCQISLAGSASGSVSGNAMFVPVAGGSGVLPVNAPPGCSWTATSNAPWLGIVTGATGSGAGNVVWSGAANSGTSARTATITVIAGNSALQSFSQPPPKRVALSIATAVRIALPSLTRAPSATPVWIADARLLPRAAPASTPVTGNTEVTLVDTVTNSGTGDAGSTQLTRTLPAGFGLRFCQLSNGSPCSLSNGTVSGSAGTLAAGQSVTMTTTGVVDATLPNGRSLTTPVKATSSDGDPTPDINTIFAVADASTATFPLALTKAGGGAGTLLTNPSSFDGRFLAGTFVVVTALPAAGFQFTGFSGDLSGNNNDQSVEMTQARSVQAAFTVLSTAGMQFVPMTPCRIADTRLAAGLFGGSILTGGSTRDFAIPGSSCGMPGTALAYALNVTVVPQGGLGYLTLWPSGQPQPLVSTLNSLDGRVKANAAVVPAGAAGGVRVYVTDTTHVVLDINGYFVPAGTAGANGLAFYPLAPCRVADTRSATGSLGGPSLAAGQTRVFPVLSSTCGIPTAARAYSLNMTAVPRGFLGYLTTWPAGSAQPYVSTLNAPTGAIVANAALVPAGAGGGISVFATDPADLVIDLNGYFAPPGAGGLLLYPLNPCRVVDTRNLAGPLGGPEMSAGQTRLFPVPSSTCGTPASAQAYVLNATVVPDSILGYLTLWPAGGTAPFVSTLNSPDGAITANAAVVQAGSQGAVNATVTHASHVILDICGYFAP